MQPAPAHVNQFAAGGRFPDGSSSTRYDCAVAVGVMMADAGTGGRVHLTDTELRGLQNDQDTNGIGWDDVAVALRKRGVTLEHGRKLWPNLTARWRAGNGAGVQGAYWVVPRPYTSQPGGRFGHALYVQRFTRPGWLLVDDPLAGAAREWPESVVRNFYLSGLALAAWVSSSSAAGADVASSSGGTVISLVNATAAASCSQVTILAPGLSGIGLYPIPRESIGQPCVECAAGYVPAIVTVGPVQSLQGFTTPQDAHGAANACVKAGTKPGDRPDSSAVVPDAIGSFVGPLIAGLGDVARNVMLLAFALVALLLGLYILATGDRGRPSLPV